MKLLFCDPSNSPPPSPQKDDNEEEENKLQEVEELVLAKTPLAKINSVKNAFIPFEKEIRIVTKTPSQQKSSNDNMTNSLFSLATSSSLSSTTSSSLSLSSPPPPTTTTTSSNPLLLLKLLVTAKSSSSSSSSRKSNNNETNNNDLRRMLFITTLFTLLTISVLCTTIPYSQQQKQNIKIMAIQQNKEEGEDGDFNLSPSPNEIDEELLDAFLENAYDDVTTTITTTTTFEEEEEVSPGNEEEEQEEEIITSVVVGKEEEEEVVKRRTTLYIKVPREEDEMTVPPNLCRSKEVFTVFLDEKKDIIALYENKLILLKEKIESLQ